MDIKKIIKVTMKAKEITTKSVDTLSKLPMQKIVAGAVITVVPGALVVTGAYMVGSKLIKKYRKSKYEQIKELEQVQLEDKEVPEKLELKEVALKKVEDVNSAVAEKTTQAKRKIVKKVAKMITKDE